ncbi:MAG: hypothetical protein LC644_10560, partial [Pseudonocardia sp.]|nr:hypothetical protein [Pseudonocardia sp.]
GHVRVAGFVWLGMVLAISFLEAPLRFRPSEVTLRIGPGIGRRASGTRRRRGVFAATLTVCVIIAHVAGPIITAAVVAGRQPRSATCARGHRG